MAYTRNKHRDLCHLTRWYLQGLSWTRPDPLALETSAPPTLEQLADELRLPWNQHTKTYLSGLLTEMLLFIRETASLEFLLEACLFEADDQWQQDFESPLISRAERTEIAAKWRARLRRSQVKNITADRAARLILELEDRQADDPDFAVALDRELAGLRNPLSTAQRLEQQIDKLEQERRRWLLQAEEDDARVGKSPAGEHKHVE